MPQVRILSLGPYRVFITDLRYEHSFFLGSIINVGVRREPGPIVI